MIVKTLDIISYAHFYFSVLIICRDHIFTHMTLYLHTAFFMTFGKAFLGNTTNFCYVFIKTHLRIVIFDSLYTPPRHYLCVCVCVKDSL